MELVVCVIYIRNITNFFPALMTKKGGTEEQGLGLWSHSPQVPFTLRHGVICPCVPTHLHVWV